MPAEAEGVGDCGGSFPFSGLSDDVIERDLRVEVGQTDVGWQLVAPYRLDDDSGLDGACAPIACPVVPLIDDTAG